MMLHLHLLALLCVCGRLKGTPQINVYGNYTGDILLVAFFPVHDRKLDQLNPANPQICGAIQEQDGIQAMEAFFYVLDKVNREPGLLHGYTLGAVVLDSCDDDTQALEQAVELIRVLMTRGDVMDLPYRCPSGLPPMILPGVAEFHKAVAIVGGSTSSVSIQLASLLKLFNLPQVSYLSTSPDLGNAERFPFFKRTVPSDVAQAKAIIDILKALGWSYVSVVYEDSNYGLKGYAELERAAAKQGICFAYTKRIDFDEPDWGRDKYEEIIRRITKKDRSNVAILWADHPRARELFAAGHRLNMTEMIWIGSDGWSGRQSPVKGYGHVVNDAITVQPMAYKLTGFDDYFKALRPNGNKRNPWFLEYWEKHFNCHWSKASKVYNQTSAKAPRTDPCTGKEQISAENGYLQQMTLHFISDAVYAFAHALASMHNQSCGGQHGLCPEMEPDNISGITLLEELRKVKFKSASGKWFEFLNGIDGPPLYTIMNYRQVAGQFTWVVIGSHSGVDGEEGLVFDPAFVADIGRYPPSSCSVPCAPNQARQFIKGERCCWLCFNCTQWQIVVSIETGGDEVCVTCFKGMQPNANRTTCVDMQVAAMSHTDPWAIACMLLALVLTVWAAVVLVVFLVHSGTPVIKAAGRELSYYLLGAIFFSYFSTFVFVARPTKATCGLTRFLLGLSYTGVYAPLLTKASRISRIFNESGRGSRTAWLTSPRAQLVIVNLLVFVQVLVLSVWLAATPPKAKYTHPSRELRVLVCAGAEDATYLIALIYPFLLMVICTMYAFRTRKTPDGFNETRFITFTCYTTFVIWLAFVPIYFVNENDHSLRTTTLCVSVSLNATVALGCIFMPKVYICLLRPAKNTREAVMARSQSVASGSSSVVANTRDQHDPGSPGNKRCHSNRDSVVSNHSRQPSSLSMDPDVVKPTSCTISSIISNSSGENSTSDLGVSLESNGSISLRNTCSRNNLNLEHTSESGNQADSTRNASVTSGSAGSAEWLPQRTYADASDVRLDVNNATVPNRSEPVSSSNSK